MGNKNATFTRSVAGKKLDFLNQFFNDKDELDLNLDEKSIN